MKALKRITCTILSFILLASAIVLPVSAVTDPEADCTAAIVAEQSTGQVLYSKDSDLRVYPASLTKIMTAIVALDAYQDGRVSLSDTVTMSENIYFDVPSDGSNLKFKAGEQTTLEELLYCIILTSANEVTNAIAEHVSGSVTDFINEMNEIAISLGCTGTHFANTHGMPNDNNYTTTYDLMLIMQKAMSIPLFATISGTEEHVVPATNMSDERSLKSTNNLIRSSSNYYYEYAKAGKTGYTDAAGYCIAAAAQQGDLSLICVVMGAKSVVIEDGSTQTQSFTEARRLFRWGFSNYGYRTILSTIDLVAEVPVELGNGSNSVVLRPDKDITALLSDDTDISQVKLNLHIYSDDAGEKLTAPIAAGDLLGEAEVSLAGVNYGTVRLVANSAVELDTAKYLTSEVRSTLTNKYVKLAIIILVIILLAYILYIVLYNVLRARKKRAADELARKRIEELRRSETPSTGMSFEEIERRHAQRRDYYTKK